MAIHLHLDALGGIAGDMFVGALLDCRPELAGVLDGLIGQAGFQDLVGLDHGKHNDGTIEGTRFRVSETVKPAPLSSVHGPGHVHHVHRRFSDIRDTLAASRLEEAVKTHAQGIFRCLAEAEARVHGMAVDEVTFHEVGAWDSIADIVCAAALIDALGVSSCSVSSLPLGRGRIDSAHGILPVPAPAVALLLEGYAFHDDGLEGERLTPTGAAILKYLEAGQDGPARGLRLAQSGFGFGARRFAGISNVLRAMLFSSQAEKPPWREERLLELAFEVDDQTAEDLALGLERIRALDGVRDLSQFAVQGKKQRLASAVRILLAPTARNSVIAACFNETATLGVRERPIARASLRRMEVSVEKDGRHYRAKLAQRPDGQVSVKAELDDLAAEELGYQERCQLREEIESLALEHLFGDDDE